jgi:hypothetical protein
MNRKIVWLEIFLLIGMSFSFSYILKESYQRGYQDESFSRLGLGESVLRFYGKILKLVFSDNLVQAAEIGAYTCIKNLDGSICQEYSVLDDNDLEACNELCEGDCIPSPREDVSECRLGTCYSPDEGTCQARAPRQSCELYGGVWYNDLYENIDLCQEGCCILGEQSIFTTEQTCQRQSDLFGIEKDFRPEVDTELGCLVLSKTQEEGACVISSQGIEKDDCRFVKKSECLQIQGEFFADTLCSNPKLDTRCEAQESTSCISGKDEVYWIDSCGNRENIYDLDKVRSFNSGFVLSKQESCSLDNDLGNSESCGNCAFLAGSVCGLEGEVGAGNPLIGDSICKDLGCVDSEGRKRDNGESWCEYQGSVGVDESVFGGRSSETPGSRHFRASCVQGQIIEEACGDYRNEICVENRVEEQGEIFSSAFCRINRWQQCYEYNFREDSQDASANTRSYLQSKKDLEAKERNLRITAEAYGKASVEYDEANSAYLSAKENYLNAKNEYDDLVSGIEGGLGECVRNPDCFVKEVSVAEKFKFNLCAPRYAPGFNLDSNSQAAEQLCSTASQKCTAVYVKRISGWRCVANCECESSKFTQQMNDLCMSLGDCGASVNYQGGFSDSGYKVHNAPRLSNSYVSEIEKYSENGGSGNEFIEAEDFGTFYSSIGLPSQEDGEVLENPIDSFDKASKIAGAIGTLLPLAASSGIAIPGLVSGSEFVAGEAVFSGNPGLTPFAGAVVGAAIGFSVTSMLIKYTGIGAGLDSVVVYGLVAAGTFAGTIIGANAVGASWAGGTLLGAAWFAAIVVVAIIVAFYLLGVGKSKKVVVSFECQPWQAAYGGDKCAECGKDGFPCSRYACDSLGQSCEFVNAGTDSELCVDVNPNDVDAPRIEVEKVSDGFELVKESNGVEIKSSENDGCIKSYENLGFNIILNEPAQCRFDTESKSFEDMEFNIGGRNLFLYNHSQEIIVPDLASLGLPGYDPDRRADYDLFVRCIDKNGNENLKDFAIGICIKPGNDVTPPIILERKPEFDYIRNGAERLNASIFTNEPSTCRYDLEDKEYDEMLFDFSCENDIADRTIYGWGCNAFFENLDNSEDEVRYVRCLDQPWLNDSIGEGTRNANSESYVFNIRKSDKLKIDSIIPGNETLVFGTQVGSVEMVVKTSGGSSNGDAVCKYSFGSNYIEFFNTFSKVHKQSFQSFSEGRKVVKVRCEDLAGNLVEDETTFYIELDNKSPKVSRVYQDSESLVIVTNEDAECRYIKGRSLTKSQCGFDFEEGILLSGSGKIHTTNLERETYYVKCKDDLGNSPGSCSVIVKKGSL